MTDLRLPTDDGEEIEALWDLPPDPRGTVVLCHPDPEAGGTMSAPLMVGITRHLVAAGLAVLRFNFRGVGSSTGHHGAGVAETADVAAAVAAATEAYPSLPRVVAGWSFGAAVALQWQAADRSRVSYVGIALPMSSELIAPLPGPDDLVPARRAFVLGDRDQFTSVNQMTEYTEAIGARLHVLPGSDHFFHFREERVAGVLIDMFSGGVDTE